MNNADIKKAEKAKVSIIMPAYNCELYIEAAIRSVINQTHTNWELFVIDDGSKDLTCDIVNKLVIKDDRIKLIKNTHNMGVAKTRNRGLDMCQGDYVAFLDSDDVWHAEKLEKQLIKMVDENGDISYTSYAIVDGAGAPSKNAYIVPENVNFNQLLKENFIGCSTVVISADIAAKYRFATDFYHEDYCLWLDILRDGYKASGCAEVLTDWRLIVNSRSFNKRKSAMNRWRIYRGHLKLSLFKSIRAFFWYMLGGLKKYYV